MGTSRWCFRGMATNFIRRDFMGCVYKVKNKQNGKVYIGKTIYSLSHRQSRHLSDAKLKSLQSLECGQIKKLMENFLY